MIINSVIAQGGIQPSGTINILQNGIVDVTNYASADVQVPTTAPAHYIEKTVVNGKLQNSTNIINLNGVTDVGDYALSGQYYNVQFPSNTTADLSSLTTLSGTYACSYMFNSCAGLTSVDLSGLTTISGQNACVNMFYGSAGLTSVDLSGLTTISGSTACSSMFGGCTRLTSVDLSSLTTISGNNACSYAFSSCTRLTSVNLSSLTTVSGTLACSNMFSYCTSLTSLYFPALTSNSFGAYTNQFTYLISGVTGCTIHFPSNLDPQSGSTVISSLDSYPNFGGTNTVLAFDLPATE